MKQFSFPIPKPVIWPEVLSSLIAKDEFLLFDIETTGLSHTYHRCILIGFVTYENGNFLAHQIFCESKNEEKALLMTFLKVAEKKNIMITYNGHAFDIPFLNSRFRANGINFTLDKEKNFDLLRLVRKNQSILNLPNLKLKTLELFLGIDRKDLISGKESVALYNHYEKTADPSAEEKILLHNREDIVYLLECLRIVDFINVQNLYESVPLRFFVHGKKGFLSDIKTKGDFLYVDCLFVSLHDKDFHHYGKSDTFIYAKDKNCLSIILPIFSVSHMDETLLFVDIDLLDIENLPFNKLSFDKRLFYLIGNKKQFNFPQILKFLSIILEKRLQHLLNHN